MRFSLVSGQTKDGQAVHHEDMLEEPIETRLSTQTRPEQTAAEILLLCILFYA